MITLKRFSIFPQINVGVSVFIGWFYVVGKLHGVFIEPGTEFLWMELTFHATFGPYPVAVCHHVTALIQHTSSRLNTKLCAVCKNAFRTSNDIEQTHRFR
jgi:hypothetical protein